MRERKGAVAATSPSKRKKTSSSGSQRGRILFDSSAALVGIGCSHAPTNNNVTTCDKPSLITRGSVVGSASSHGADCKDVIISSQGFESYADPNEKPVEVSSGCLATPAFQETKTNAHTPHAFCVLVQVVLAKVNQDSAAYVWPLNEVRAG